MASVETFLSARSESFGSVVSSEGAEYGAHGWLSGSPSAIARMPTQKRAAHTSPAFKASAIVVAEAANSRVQFQKIRTFSRAVMAA